MGRSGMARWLRGACGAVFLIAVTASGASAGTVFTDFGSHASRFGDGFSLGSEFTDVTPGLEATALGIHFENSNAPLQAHEIGLWDVTAGNTMVADVTMPSGGAGTFSLGGFLYISLPVPVLLNAGDRYVLAAFYPAGRDSAANDQIKDCCGSGNNPSTDPAFTAFLAVFSSTNTAGQLTEPLGGAAGTDYTGVNLEFQAVPVPEPTTLSLLGLATFAVGLLRRRAGRRANRA
jgi:hypothetical protein